MNTIEDALKKLDRIEQNLNNQAEEITIKDNRIAQLEKLFHGTAQIFNKQHNFVDQLKKQLEVEKQQKGISQEKSTHLQTDIERLDQEKKELEKRVKELSLGETEIKKIRDKELAEVKEKLTKSTQQLAEVQAVDQLAYAELGKFSNKTGLLLRSQEIVQNLQKWTNAFPGKNPEEAKIWTFSDNEFATIRTLIGGLNFENWDNLKESDFDFCINLIKIIPAFKPNDPNLFGIEKTLIRLKNLLLAYKKELFWWEKWMSESVDKEGIQKQDYGFDRKSIYFNNYELNLKIKKVNSFDYPIIRFFSSYPNDNIFVRSILLKRQIKLISEYYKNK